MPAKSAKLPQTVPVARGVTALLILIIILLMFHFRGDCSQRDYLLLTSDMAQQSTSRALSESPADTSQSPPPTGLQGDLEVELIGLANALYNLGTTVINDSTKERSHAKAGNHNEGSNGKPVGQRVNDVIEHLVSIEELAGGLKTSIPMQVLQYVSLFAHF